MRKAPEATPQGTPEICVDHWPAGLIVPPPPSHSVETRTKRPRAHSPQLSSTPLAPASVGSARNSTTPAQRGSTGSQPSTPTLRETKHRSLRDTLLRQAPLQEGRMVAFHPPSSGKAADGTSPEDTTWIMAKIVKAFHQDKYRYVRPSSAHLNSAAQCDVTSYEVEDIEPQEDGKPLYVITMIRKSLVPHFVS